jgi:hypothetical protein
MNQKQRTSDEQLGRTAKQRLIVDELKMKGTKNQTWIEMQPLRNHGKSVMEAIYGVIFELPDIELIFCDLITMMDLQKECGSQIRYSELSPVEGYSTTAISICGIVSIDVVWNGEVKGLSK